MITREEAIQRLEGVVREITELKRALEQGWNEAPTQDRTQAFLEKCQGWEDTRSPEEIVSEIYASRTLSERDVIFSDERHP